MVRYKFSVSRHPEQVEQEPHTDYKESTKSFCHCQHLCLDVPNYFKIEFRASNCYNFSKPLDWKKASAEPSMFWTEAAAADPDKHLKADAD